MEIERKFLVKDLPDISGIQPIVYERYYLKSEGDTVVRIQKKNNKYEYETKKTISDLEHEKNKHAIAESEFEDLKVGNDANEIIRESYELSLNPNVSIKIYHGRFEGLMRVEVEFSTKEEAEKYVPPSWMGEEITTTSLGADAWLLHLSQDEFERLMA